MNSYDGTFIVGAPRSGTTLLQSLIAAHSMYYSLPETSFFTSILPQLGIIYNNPHAKLRPEDIDAIRSNFRYMTGRSLPALPEESDTADVRTFFHIMLQAFNSDNKPRWVEKTTNHARSMMAIRRFFPCARFIHIIRDPVDSVASMRSIRPTSWRDRRIAYVGSYRESAQLWVRCVEAALRYPDPDKVLHLHYEDLLAEPEAQLRRLFMFLGVPYEDGILETYARQAERLYDSGRNPWQASTSIPGIRRDDRHKWRQRLSRTRVWLIQHYTEDLARYLGYFDARIRMSPLIGMAALAADGLVHLVARSRIEHTLRGIGMGGEK